MITKNLVVEIENFVMNHKSWPVKSNPEYTTVGVNDSNLTKLFCMNLYTNNISQMAKEIRVVKACVCYFLKTLYTSGLIT